MIKEQYTNVDSDIISLLIEFFETLKIKATGYAPARYLSKTITNLKNNPLQPEQNVFVSFEYDESVYYVTYSDYKIELTDFVTDYYEDEDGNKSDYNQIQQYIFRYEKEGYIEVNGNIDEFKLLLIKALNNANIQKIDISDEE